MAEMFFNQMARGKARAVSAGSRPAESVHPAVIQAMGELGINLKGKKPQKLTPKLLAEADRVISMGCGEACPVTSIAQEDWQIDDPAGKPLPEVRRIRDEVQASVARLVKELRI